MMKGGGYGNANGDGEGHAENNFGTVDYYEGGDCGQVEEKRAFG